MNLCSRAEAAALLKVSEGIIDRLRHRGALKWCMV
jgi:hypothetical protein